MYWYWIGLNCYKKETPGCAWQILPGAKDQTEYSFQIAEGSI